MPISDQNKTYWIAAAVLGLLVWVFTAAIGDLSFFAGLVLGLISAALFGAFLGWLLGGKYAGDGSDWAESTQQSFMAEEPVSPESGETAAAPDADEQADEQIAPAGDAQLSDNGAKRPVSKRNDIYGGKASSTAADQKKKKPAPAKKKTADVSAATADDLKEIKGVGPKLEELLHKNGVTRFSQIAAWGDADIDQFAGLIGRMGGRIRSDDWVRQARILADGGETEFSKRVDKGEVYA